MKPVILILVVLISACVSTASSQRVTVTETVDGDTLEIRYSDGGDDTLRLLGVDTPEIHGAVNPGEFDADDTPETRKCLRRWAVKAAEYAGTLDGRNVTLRQDRVQDLRGDYGRLLGYVYFNGSESFNYRLVEKGYARVYDSRFEQRQRFIDAEKAAREERSGVWSCS